MRSPAQVRLILFVSLLAAAALLGGCVTTRYARDWTLAGEEFTDTLELSGNSFRLERTSGLGPTLFMGRFDTTGEEWRFEIVAWRPPDGPWMTFTPPVVYRYRGHAFLNGIAFYAVTAPRSSPLELFIRVPSDFDVVP
jgi:hypothetical protein